MVVQILSGKVGNADVYFDPLAGQNTQQADDNTGRICTMESFGIPVL